jgi:hypothetical protein
LTRRAISWKCPENSIVLFSHQIRQWERKRPPKVLPAGERVEALDQCIPAHALGSAGPSWRPMSIAALDIAGNSIHSMR